MQIERNPKSEDEQEYYDAHSHHSDCIERARGVIEASGDKDYPPGVWSICQRISAGSKHYALELHQRLLREDPDYRSRYGDNPQIKG